MHVSTERLFEWLFPLLFLVFIHTVIHLNVTVSIHEILIPNLSRQLKSTPSSSFPSLKLGIYMEQAFLANLLDLMYW